MGRRPMVRFLQRHQHGPYRRRAHRRLLRAFETWVAVSDLQSLYHRTDRQWTLSTGSCSGQYYSAELTQSAGAKAGGHISASEPARNERWPAELLLSGRPASAL